MTFCVQCGSVLADGAAFCSACGHRVSVPAPLPPAPPPAVTPMPPPVPVILVQPHLSPVAVSTPPVSQATAILALVLNIIVWPGLGSLIAGEKIGWAQGFLFLFAIPLMFVLIGIPLAIGVWVWGIVTGVELLKRANAQETERLRVGAMAAQNAPPPAR